MRRIKCNLLFFKKRPVENLLYVLSLYTKNQKVKLLSLSVAGILINLLDLFGIILIGLIGSLAALGVTGEPAGGLTKTLIDTLNIGELSLARQLSLLGAFAGSFLILKTILSYIVQKRLAVFIQARITELISRYLRSTLVWDLSSLAGTPRRQMLQSLQSGIPNLVGGVTMPAFLLGSDIVLILVLSSALFFTEPFLAFATAGLFSLVALYLHFRLSIKQRRMGAELSQISLSNQLNFENLVEGFREAYVRDIRENLIITIEKNRNRAGEILSNFAITGQIGKYAFEITMVFGASLIVLHQVLFSNSSRAVAVIGIFIASSARIGPAILRIQSSILGIRRSVAQSEYTLNLLKQMKFEKMHTAEIQPKLFPSKHHLEGPAFEFIEVEFKYPSNSKELIGGFSFRSIPGEHIAIIGRSGAGKTTLVDLLVGALTPTSGRVTLFGLNPREFLSRFPGAVSYLPQQVIVMNGTLRENICFGYESKKVPEEKIWRALSLANLETWVKSLKDGLDFLVWDQGANMSGGQRQRLGLARALLTEPSLLILDEATSALDNQTQSEVSATLHELKGKLTLVMIAHRLESIMKTDRVLYFSEESQIQVLNPRSLPY